MAIINGDNNNNYLIGTHGDDTIHGYGGNDVIYAFAGKDFLYGGDGNDFLSGADGDDYLFGEAGNDSLNGGNGNDFLVGGAGNDLMYGDAGDDTYFVDSLGDRVTEFANRGTDLVWSAISYTLSDYVENLTLVGINTATAGYGNSLNNVLRGNQFNNSLYGYGGNDYLYGEAGDDRLDGGIGHDRMYGGIGNDTYIVDNSHDIVIEYAHQGTHDLVYASVDFTLTNYVESLKLQGSAIKGSGNSGDNYIIGNQYDNSLWGYDGTDRLYGENGNDTLYGGDGDDYLEGGDGNDYLYGESGNDTLKGNDGNDFLYGGIGDDFLDGGDGDDLLKGEDGNDSINGGDGDDLIYGGDGLDELNAGDGNDTVYGGDDNDDITGEAGNDELDGGDGDDFLQGNQGNDKLRGRDGNDILEGGTGNDRLKGDDGDDRLAGGLGNDILEGGDGNDILLDSDIQGGTFADAKVALDNNYTPQRGGWISFDKYPRHLADINGDGFADIVAFGEFGVASSLANGDGTFADAKAAFNDNFTPSKGGWTSFNRYPRHLADITGDGLADIVGFSEFGVISSEANGDGTFADVKVALDNNFTPTQGGWSSFDKYPRHLADVNGDGLADIVGFGESEVYTSLANGDGTFADAKVAFTDNYTPQKGGWTNFNRYPRHLADINGDGFADIVGFSEFGVISSAANGDGTFAEVKVALDNNYTPTQGGWISFDKYPRQLADINGDGLADIVGFAEESVLVSLAKGDGTFNVAEIALDNNYTPSKGGWTNFNRYPRQLADVNGDGRADIVGFAEVGVLTSLANESGGNDTLKGGKGNDVLKSGAGNDLLLGERGDDLLIGGAGNDTLDGGKGADKFVFEFPTDGVDIIRDFNRHEGDMIYIETSFGASSAHQFSYNSHTGGLFFDASLHDHIGATQIAIIENSPAGFSINYDITIA